jgi:hypothetical protein
MKFKEALDLLETVKLKKVVRQGKIIKKKTTNRDGYKIDAYGKEVRMSAQEKMRRKKAGIKAARKSKSKRSSASIKRKRSMKKINR